MVRGDETLDSVDRVAAVLRACAAHQGGKSVRDLAADLTLSKSAVHRLLVSLEHVGFLHYDSPSGRYSIGEGILELAATYPRRSDLVGESRPMLSDLWSEVGETVCLHMAVGWQRMTIFQYESPHDLRFATSIGELYPLYAGAAGRALLSLFPDGEIEQYLDDVDLKPVTGRTIVGKDDLLDGIARTRTDGYAFSHGERVTGAIGIAAPIAVPGRPPLCVSVYGPAERIRAAQTTALAKAVVRTAQACAAALGGGR
ncbi:IclR family transcriptional regulator [Verrucosispora sp. SN26_14.1]|uniref:IclR family transcriptional regulator n=1 Tax=Verrucosispora sp. SN26_14.1 TaxID=2527879 RepID=UPI001033FD33|nr:IclR family transcriptional regulator [Verrucosispora sp. SN26_14.1]TBL44516.1 IclR family transcriptional regulator [Verrucosispora sp. SN26_14.1]